MGRIPEATIARLPIYLRALQGSTESGIATISSEELALATGVNSAKVRKDLSFLGSYGTRGVGYDVDYLTYQVSAALGVTQEWRIIIIGVGNLGHALADYAGFGSRGFRVCALIDADPARIGLTNGENRIESLERLEAVIADREPQIAVIAVPGEAAQRVATRVVAAGITSILNFASTVLHVPEQVAVRKVDLSTELQILAFHEQRRTSSGADAVIENLI
jgi:redox-sensing transcriptional repressor